MKNANVTGRQELSLEALDNVNGAVELDEEYIRNHPIRTEGDLIKQAFEFAPKIPGAIAEFGKDFGGLARQQYNEWVCEQLKEKTLIGRLSLKLANWWHK